jgi:hypothetical protein
VLFGALGLLILKPKILAACHVPLHYSINFPQKQNSYRYQLTKPLNHGSIFSTTTTTLLSKEPSCLPTSAFPKTSSFTCFSELPPELQVHIIHDAWSHILLDRRTTRAITHEGEQILSFGSSKVDEGNKRELYTYRKKGYHHIGGSSTSCILIERRISWR